MSDWDRVLIVNDETGKWFVRRVASVMHDLRVDEKVYTCDAHLGGPFDTPLEAMGVAMDAIGWDENKERNDD